jgi:hypothetical protein
MSPSHPGRPAASQRTYELRPSARRRTKLREQHPAGTHSVGCAVPQVPLPGPFLLLCGAMPGAKRWRDDELDALATLMEEAGGEVTDWDALAAQLPNDPDHAIRTGRAAKAMSIKEELLDVAKRRRRHSSGFEAGRQPTYRPDADDAGP